MSAPQYVWTAQDELIAKGITAGSMQGPWVTPYGLASRPEDARISPGTRVEVNLDSSQEPWRARRFYQDKLSPHDKHYAGLYEWVPFDPPRDLRTLRDLCRHLRTLEPNAYPESLYGEKKVDVPKGAQGGMQLVNTAQMLFDYLENSAYRYDVVNAGFSWVTYKEDPGSIPIRGPNAALGFVLKFNSVIEVTTAPNEAATAASDPLDAVVEGLIKELDDHAATVKAMIDLTNRTLEKRLDMVRRLGAISAIASIGADSPLGSDGPEVMQAIGADQPENSSAILGRAYDFMMRLPVKRTESLESALRSNRVDPQFCRDAAETMLNAGRELKKLLREDNEYLPKIIDWAGKVISELNAEQDRMNGFASLDKALHPNALPAALPKLIDQLDRLTLAMGVAHSALAECGSGDEADELIALYEAVPEKRSKDKASAAKTRDLTKIIFNVLGRPANLVVVGLGNLAGPPTLHVAFIDAFVARKFQSIAAKGASRTATLAAEYADFADRVIKVVPKVWEEDPLSTLAESFDLREALADNDDAAIKTVIDGMRKKVLDSTHRTHLHNSFFVLMQSLATGYAFYAAFKDDRPFDRGVVRVTDWLTALSDLGMFGTGAVDALVNRMKDVPIKIASVDRAVKALASADGAKVLARWGNAFGFASSVLGVISGIVDIATADDNWGRACGLLEVLGGMGMAYTSFYLMVGATTATMPALLPVELVALACLVAAGAINMREIYNAFKPPTNQSALSLVESLRGNGKDISPEPLWVVMEAHLDIKATMDRIQELCDGRLPPGRPGDEDGKTRLRKAGLPEEFVQRMFVDVVSSTGGASSSGSGGDVAGVGGAGPR